MECNVFDIDFNGVFDEMLEGMQQPGQREAMQKKWCNGCSYGSHCLGADPDCACCKAGDEGCYPK